MPKFTGLGDHHTQHFLDSTIICILNITGNLWKPLGQHGNNLSPRPHPNPVDPQFHYDRVFAQFFFSMTIEQNWCDTPTHEYSYSHHWPGWDCMKEQMGAQGPVTARARGQPKEYQDILEWKATCRLHKTAFRENLPKDKEVSSACHTTCCRLVCLWRRQVVILWKISLLSFSL